MMWAFWGLMAGVAAFFLLILAWAMLQILWGDNEPLSEERR